MHTAVQLMAHGEVIAHEQWVVQQYPLPWVMGCTTPVVQRCMAHDPWVFVTVVSPMGHGK